MKPILFNTQMVQAILGGPENGDKTACDVPTRSESAVERVHSGRPCIVREQQCASCKISIPAR